MHIPDGFIAPQMYLPLYGLAAGLWAYGAKRVARELDEATLPWLAALTAASFALSFIALPLPGGTSAHVTGVGLLAASFGIWNAFMAASMVFAIQALLFGDGGVTTLPLNALAMGFAGALAARGLYLALRRWPIVALFAAGWIGLCLPSLLIALALGAQPLIAHDAAGAPLYFPFGWSVTLPALLIPHALLGLGEGALTVLGGRLIERLRLRYRND
ncbi:MAG: cobalamin biosynthesis protein CbiM [Hydrogenophilales bacterium CG17_big_fil_post_rev_8_21_14_2_50_63_12]|nr:MAG: cobalamin biosynthesis protein CbiM [Hydrogenophilales bacterium CG17_big_fil_post_rev_8_21_14_2_50_63_12]PIX97646.1 MAG: cobalamin biosynthesis protein CbiM [Hydrogenophilales bacterium CG_4_10_14_3_um_filter_63_21]PJB04531.1 MAG: cobalamin biosynthesis protein CbiM [Hydrogenophilales bacterium CG_4_9_14_3_um_filter_63_34]